MNIFFLYADPVKAAQDQCDKHIVKMPMEAVQLLCTAVRVLMGQTKEKSVESDAVRSMLDEAGLYRITHVNHPTSVWVRTSRRNFNWTLKHAYALFAEYSKRYGREHASLRILAAVEQYAPRLKFPEKKLTVPPQCVKGKENEIAETDTCSGWDCVVKAYRQFYIKDKARFAKWAHSPQPGWFDQKEIEI